MLFSALISSISNQVKGAKYYVKYSNYFSARNRLKSTLDNRCRCCIPRTMQYNDTKQQFTIRFKSSDTSRKRRTSKIKAIPSLKDFIHKSKILAQYRSFLRNALRIDDKHSRTQVYNEIRDSFRKYSLETDTFAIKLAMKESERKLIQLRSMVPTHTSSNQITVVISNDDAQANGETKKDSEVGVLWPWKRKHKTLHTNFEKYK